MKKALLVGIVFFTVCMYAGIVVWGVHASRRSRGLSAERAQVELGRAIFDHTPQYASSYVGDALSCESCHAEGGTQGFAMPLIDVARRFPQYSSRAGRTISLQDRIRECFVRSENGAPLDNGSDVMRALVAYLNSLTRAADDRRRLELGVVNLPALEPDPVRGDQIYKGQCAGCHGSDGAGTSIAPPLWGERSFNQGAGMNRLGRFAAFVQHNMPQNRMGILTPQDSYDVSAFVLAHARRAMNVQFARY